MKRVYFVLLFLLLILFCVTVSVTDLSEELSFTFNEYCRSDAVISVLPSTYEATIFFPLDMKASDRGGVISGNYKDSSNQRFNFEIHKNGNPRLYVIDEHQNTY